jgi:alkylhydroperoxidase/carboxymuconolactone decarboxylase family protein YurZ
VVWNSSPPLRAFPSSVAAERRRLQIANRREEFKAVDTEELMMPTEQDLLERAAAVMEEVIPAGVRNPDGSPDPVMRKFGDLVQVAVMGAVWSRPGLDLKTRTIITVASDVTAGSFPELAIHARMALTQGWTRDELVEVVLHLLGYVGAPRVRTGIATLSEVFAAEDARSK